MSEGPLLDRVRALGVQTRLLPLPIRLARLGEAGSGQAAGHFKQVQLIGRVTRSAPGALGYTRRLRRLLGQLRPSIIHSNGLKTNLLAGLARPSSCPLVWHIHDYLSGRPVTAWLLRRRERSCNLVLVNSRSVGADVIEAGLGRSKVVCLYNAIDQTRFSPTGPTLDLDALSGMPPSPRGVVRVGIVATFARWKGHETFLQALAKMPADLAIRGYVVGDAIYATEGSQYRLQDLRSRARNLGLESRVGFTGFVSEPAAAMRALDIVVHASTEPEPFGLAIVEAMACGKAVIVSEGGGSGEIIETNVTALSCRPGDSTYLPAQIQRLAVDELRRGQLGTAAVVAARRFSRERLVKELLPLYRGLIRNTEAPERETEQQLADGGQDS